MNGRVVFVVLVIECVCDEQIQKLLMLCVVFLVKF